MTNPLPSTIHNIPAYLLAFHAGLVQRDGSGYDVLSDHVAAREQVSAKTVVPLPLREILGRSEICRSLRTKDYEEAKRRWKQESLRVDALFEKARRGAVVPASLPRMSEADREITLDYYADKL